MDSPTAVVQSVAMGKGPAGGACRTVAAHARSVVVSASARRRPKASKTIASVPMTKMRGESGPRAPHADGIIAPPWEAALPDVQRHDPHPRFRLAVHPAHRTALPGAPGLFRNRPA